MTLAFAEGLIEYPQLPIESIGGIFYKWHEEIPTDIGSIVAATIRHYKELGDRHWAAELTHSE